MKKVILFFSLFFATYVFANQLPEKDRFILSLNKVYQGQCQPALKGVPVKMSYDFDFNKNIGYAKLEKIAGTSLDIELHPLGVASGYVFMSDISPTSVMVNGKQEVLYRIFFDLSKSGEKAAAIMFGDDGDCILSTSNY